jgi:hypothetical protein
MEMLTTETNSKPGRHSSQYGSWISREYYCTTERIRFAYIQNLFNLEKEREKFLTRKEFLPQIVSKMNEFSSDFTFHYRAADQRIKWVCVLALNLAESGKLTNMLIV